MKIPVFITTRDRLTTLPRLVSWLEKTNQAEIIFVDNDSRWQPLLDYLGRSPHKKYMLNDNHAKWAPWEHNLIEKHPSEFFAVSDPDMYPIGECPVDAIEFWINALKDSNYSQYHCVGPSLEISDLPACYKGRREAVRWEAQYWAKPLYDDQVRCKFFEAPIDSMFAVFRKGGKIDITKPSIRSNYPYVFHHSTWYSDSDNISDEDLFYIKRADHNRAHWVREGIPESLYK